VLEDLYNHPTGAPSPNEWNNFATVEPRLVDKRLASKIHCVDDEIIEWLERHEAKRATTCPENANLDTGRS
jgi:hypothetical protein